MKALFITDSNNDPRNEDDWSDVIILSEESEMSEEEMIAMCDEERKSEGYAIWFYEGDEYEDKLCGRRLASGAMVYDMLFHPWDTDDVKLIREADDSADDDDWMEDWRREIAMEAGMMGGCDAYNETMGY